MFFYLPLLSIYLVFASVCYHSDLSGDLRSGQFGVLNFEFHLLNHRTLDILVSLYFKFLIRLRAVDLFVRNGQADAPDNLCIQIK